jgi:peptide/nickel transport system substrate-binding protein
MGERSPDLVTFPTLTLHAENIDHQFVSWNRLPSQSLVFSSFFKYDPEGEPIGDVVDSWEHSSDYRTWTYRLRAGIRWHDGVPFTAHDIKFTLDLFAHPEVLIANPEAYSIEVLDDYSVEVTHHLRALDPMTDYLFILPSHLLSDLDPAEFASWGFWQNPVGSGPYRFVRLIPQTMMELEANPEYHGTDPKIQRVVLRTVGSPVVELLSGAIDASGSLNQGYLPFAENPNFEIYFRPAQQRSTILWNHRSPFFRQSSIRRAVTLAMDRREVARFADLPDEVPLVDGPASPRQFVDGTVPPVVPFDPVLAGEVLDAEGWTDTNGDGIRDRDGIEFRFVAFTTGFSTGEAVVVQAQLREVGIDMEIHTFSSGPILRAQMAEGNFDAVFQRTAWRTDAQRLLDTEDRLHLGYTNPELDRIIAEAEEDWAPGWEERRNDKIWAIFQEDFPLTYLRPWVQITVANGRVRGLQSPGRVIPSFGTEFLWIEEEG